MARKKTPSIDPPIPLEAIAQLEELLDRSLGGWETKEPRWHSPSPDTLVDDAWFDVVAVVKVVRALRRMPHTKGRQWARTPFEPATWQLVWLIAPVFGWKHADGTRIIREVWDEIPRKNGKSTISARLGLVLAAADGEWGGEVYAAATSMAQAKVVLDQAREVALRSPSLKRKCEPLAEVIRFPRTGSIFRALSRMADAAHGLNVSGAVVDEVHLHKNRGLIVAIETGTGAREQPLIIFITTAGDDDDTTIYAEKHNYAVRIGDGHVKDPTVWAVIWAAGEDDDYLAEETWAKANPNYPTSPTPAFLQKEFSQLVEKPQKLGELLRLHLNIRHGIAEGIWPGAEAWADHPGIVELEELEGREAWGGLVGALATELAALCWPFENPDGDGY
ncbi:MAG: terminase large subunit, partial [Actinomycetota bacterium]